MSKLLTALMLTAFVGAGVLTTIARAQSPEPAQAGYHEQQDKKKKKKPSAGSNSGE